MNNSVRHAVEERNVTPKKNETDIAKCAENVERFDSESIPRKLFDSDDEETLDSDKHGAILEENVVQFHPNSLEITAADVVDENCSEQTQIKGRSIPDIEPILEIVEEAGDIEATNKRFTNIDTKQDRDCNFNHSNNNNVEICQGLTSFVKGVSSNEIDTTGISSVENEKADDKKLLFTIANSNIFHQNSVQQRRQLLPFKYR